MFFKCSKTFSLPSFVYVKDGILALITLLLSPNFSNFLIYCLYSLLLSFVRIHESSLRKTLVDERCCNQGPCMKYTACIYLFKGSDVSTRTLCEICSHLRIKTPERRHWRRSGVFIVNFEHVSPIFLMFILLILNNWMSFGFDTMRKHLDFLMVKITKRN